MSTKSIDWSKAPEGATHFEAARDESECDVFWRVKDGVALQVWRLIPWKKDPSEQVETFTYSLKGCDDFDASRAVPRPVSWPGQGLPPVGTACEWLDPGSDRWLPVEIVFLSSWVIVVRDTNPHPDGSVDLAFDLINEAPQFRAVRTPEQIVAEEREAAISDIFEVLTGSRDQAAWSRTCYSAHAANLYDAGYRKVEGGAA